MTPIRQLSRWVLTLVALSLAIVALLTLLVRLGLGLAEGFMPRLESLLSARFGAEVQIRELDTGLTRFDPVVALSGLVIRSRQGLGNVPLLEVGQARLQLDAGTTLLESLPVVEDARIQDVTLHLYQDVEGRWLWPDPARLPPELELETELDLEHLDFWVGLLLRQRAWVENFRLVLHGQERRIALHAPRLLMSGDARRAQLEGQLRLEDPALDREAPVMQVALEILPGPSGMRDFSAALQADMQFDSLMSLVEVLGAGDPFRLEASSGNTRLWGRWHRGQLADARLDLEVPRLAMSHRDKRGELRRIVLNDLQARSQWLRRDDGWEAWLEGDAESAERDEPRGLNDRWGPALPRYWHLRRSGDDWGLNTTAFDLGSLAAWRDRIPLPEALSRVIDSLDPRGRITGLGLGRKDDQWVARAAIRDVAVSPWQRVPGVGPLDMWVEARGLKGKVLFAGDDGTELHFPEVFGPPLSLSRASGEVRWSYDGPRTVVSGRDLRVGWQGADVEGDFGLSAVAGERGGFGLSLGFRDVDAIDTPLSDWLPMEILGEELRAWLGNGVEGRVPEGALRLHVPISGGASRIPPTFGLDLTIEEGRLPFAADWPALDAVSGELSLQDGRLTARVDHAESLGVEAREGRVSLEEGQLDVNADLSASAGALRDYLLAIPAEGMAMVDDWRGEGSAEGRLGLALTLGEPGSLALEVATEVALSRLTYTPMDLTFSDLAGLLTWHQEGTDAGLEGRLEGRLLGSPLRADIDTRSEGIDLSGTTSAPALSRWAGAPALEEILEGQFPWQGRLTFGEGSGRLRLDSSLEGLAVALPAPLGKSAAQRRPLVLNVDLAGGRIEGRLGDQLNLRWRDLPGSTIGQGQLWLGRPPLVDWPSGEGWWIDAFMPRLDLAAWRQAMSGLAPPRGTSDGADGMIGRLRAVRLETACLENAGGCVGSLQAEGRPQADGGWRGELNGSLLAGQVDYRPGLRDALDIRLTRLSLDGFLPDLAEGGTLMDQIATPPAPEPLPSWVGDLPDGRLRIAEIDRQGRRFGPFTSYWQATPERLTLAPLGLTLGEISARGELVWETAGASDSLTRARLDLDGRDLGSALERLGQPGLIRSQETRVSSQLAWPGTPWQFALERSRGSVEVFLRDGRFVNIESPTARLVGLLNVDNLLRRLRLDFSDVTRQGTAFDSVTGTATLYGGILETNGPLEVEGPATFFSLEGTVDLVRRELDQHLSVTVPVSRNLPLAAVIAGAPVVGGALFIADRLFGDALDRVTRIHYRVRGPWTSPQISVESAE